MQILNIPVHFQVSSMVITSLLNNPLASVQVTLIFASVGKSVGGVYVAALTSISETVMAPRAPIPARVVPSLTKRGNAVFLNAFILHFVQ